MIKLTATLAVLFFKTNMKTPDGPKPNDNTTKNAREKRFKSVKKQLRIIKQGTVSAKDHESFYKSEGVRDEVPTWQIYDSRVDPQEGAFKDILPKGFLDFVKTNYPDRLGDLIGMELGGPGSNLFHTFPKGIFKETVGVTLEDMRSEYKKLQDDERNHSVIIGDVLSRKPDSILDKKSEPTKISFVQIEKWVSEHGKVDFLVERMVGGIDMVRDKAIFIALLRRWYSLLSDSGVMFIEMPPFAAMRISPEDKDEILATVGSNEDETELVIGATVLMVKKNAR